MGVRITHRDGRAIGIGGALLRELYVVAARLGFGLPPLIALITSVLPCRQLSREGVTLWDKDKDWVVTHRPWGPGQEFLGTIGVLFLLFLMLVYAALGAE